MTSTLVYSNDSSGYLVAPFSVTSTSLLASMTSGGYAVSTASFNQSNTGGAIQGNVWFVNTSTSGVQQTAGANFAGWWVHSDAAGNFEVYSTVAGMPRAPDFIVPLPSTSTSLSTSGFYAAQGQVILPPDNFKVFVQNNAGVTLGSTAGYFQIGPIAYDVV